MGSKALNVKATPIPGKEWWDPYFDPIFDELERTNTPIIFHDTKTGSMGQERFADNFFFSHMVGRTIESMVCLMIYLCGGVMEKHPDLKIICLETGASQMPWGCHEWMSIGRNCPIWYRGSSAGRRIFSTRASMSAANPSKTVSSNGRWNISAATAWYWPRTRRIGIRRSRDR